MSAATPAQPSSSFDAPRRRHRHLGLLGKLRAAVTERIDSRKLELLVADDLTGFHREAQDELALRIRSVSRWLGSPYGGQVQKAIKVKLCQIDDEGVHKERLRLTDEGVDAMARRLGITFILFSPEDSAGWLICRVQTTFADGSTMECAGRAKSADPDAAQKAQAVAHRLAVYHRIGIPSGRPVQNLDMEFVGRVRQDVAAENVVVPGVGTEPLVASGSRSTGNAEGPGTHPAASRPAARRHALSGPVSSGLPAAVMALGQVTEATPQGGLVPDGKRAVDVATGEITQGPRETVALDVMRRELNAYLRELGYNDDGGNQVVIQEGLGLSQPRAIGELDEAQVQVLLEEKEGLFPPKTALALQEPLRI